MRFLFLPLAIDSTGWLAFLASACGLAFWCVDMSRSFRSMCCKACRKLMNYVGRLWLFRSFSSGSTYVEFRQIFILSDSSFWAYDGNYRRHSYKMPFGNIKHYAKGGADLLHNGIQSVLEHHNVSLYDLTNSRVIFLHMPSSLHQDVNKIQEADYEEWKYNMKKAAHVHYTWANRNGVTLEICLLIDPNSYDTVWVPQENERCKGQNDLRRVISEKHEFEEARIQIITPRSRPSDWFWGHWTPFALTEGCDQILGNLGLV